MSSIYDDVPLFRDPARKPEPPAPYRHLQRKIELAAGVSITVMHFGKDDEDFPQGWYATASRQVERAYAGGITTRTIANSSDQFGAFNALDKLAAKLGVSVEADIPGIITSERLAS